MKKPAIIEIEEKKITEDIATYLANQKIIRKTYDEINKDIATEDFSRMHNHIISLVRCMDDQDKGVKTLIVRKARLEELKPTHYNWWMDETIEYLTKIIDLGLEQVVTIRTRTIPELAKLCGK